MLSEELATKAITGSNTMNPVITTIETGILKVNPTDLAITGNNNPVKNYIAIKGMGK